MILSLLFALLILQIASTGAQPTIHYSAGAEGNPTTVGSLGFAVSIQTHAYDIDNPGLPIRGDAFWVGADLADGGFIQFGYNIQSGYSCLNQVVASNNMNKCEVAGQVTNGDPRWFWEYFPKLQSNVWNGQVGPTMSGGVNGTWHSYKIADNANQTWSFILDGVRVSSLNVAPSPSTTPPQFAAEQETTGDLGRLGPVEFRNLSYFRSGVWRPVDFLNPLKSCGVNVTCALPNPYDVLFLGQNDVLVGSLKPLPQVVSNASPTSNIYLIPVAILFMSVLILTGRYAMRRKL